MPSDSATAISQIQYPYPIHFEDCGYGYWIWDIAVALCRWAWDADWERMRDAFRDGYNRIRALPEVQWAQIDLFVATQFATMVLWASAFLRHDPARVARLRTLAG